VFRSSVKQIILTMSPSRIDDPLPSFSANSITGPRYSGPPRNVAPIEALKFGEAQRPKAYEIERTHPESVILFLDVNIFDSTGREPFRGDVLIEGRRITKVGVVPNVEELKHNPKVRVFHGRGRTLMSGLGDAHTNFTWNGGDLNRLGDLGIEEHVLLTARSAQCYVG
jgi:hypothetical protein